MSTWSRSDTGGGSFYESMVDNAARCTCMLSSKNNKQVHIKLDTGMLQPLLFFFPHTVKCYISGHSCNCLFCAFAYTAVRTRHAVGTVPGNYRYFSSFNYWSYLLLIINASRMRERRPAVSLVISYTLAHRTAIGRFSVWIWVQSVV